MLMQYPSITAGNRTDGQRSASTGRADDQQDEAARPRSRRTWSAAFRGVGITGQRREPEYTNLLDLAMRSLDLVSDFTGTIATPDCYVHDEIELRFGVFPPHQGWTGEVACYRGELVTADGDRVFVALFGTASNIVGRRSADDAEGESPSDVYGLYGLLNAAREEGDPSVDDDYLWDDYTVADQLRADIAIQHATVGAQRDRGRLEFLAKVFLDVEDQRWRDGDFHG